MSHLTMVYDGSPMTMTNLHTQAGRRLTLEDNQAVPTAHEGLVMMGMYNSTAPTYTDGDAGFLQFTADGRAMVDANVTVENIDVQLGAVELKNATDNTRAVIQSDGTDNALVVMMNSLPTGDNVLGKMKITGNLSAEIAEVIGGRLRAQVTGSTVAISAVIPGTGPTYLGKAEDAAHASGDVGVMSLAVRNDTLAALGGTDGDYSPLQVNATGALFNIEVPTTEATAAPSVARDTSVDEVAAVAIKAAAGNMYGYMFDNPNGYDVFVKWYNTAAGSVTVGTTSVVRTTRVPAIGSVFVEGNKPQQNFTTAIAIACTKLIADGDTTALATDIYAEVYYK